MMRPFIKWAGGKMGVIDQITHFFPSDCTRYIEPFVGGGAAFFVHGAHMPYAWLNDLNIDVIELYEVVRDSPTLLCQQLDEFRREYSETQYYRLRDLVTNDKVVRAARTLYLNKTGFNGLYRQNSKGRFNVPFGKRPVCPALYDVGNILEISSALANVQITCWDFGQVLMRAGEGDLVYCDPPYEPISQTAAFTAYTSKGFDQHCQTRLKEAAVSASQRGAKVVISNSDSPFILDLYDGHQIDRIKARRSINSKGDKRGPIDELVITIKT